MQTNTVDLADQIAKQLIQQKEEKPRTKSYIQLASIYEKANNLTDAMYILQEGLQVYPTSLSLHRALWTFYANHNIDRGKSLHIPRTIKRVLNKKPIRFFEFLQRIFLKNHEYKTSLELLKMELQTNPEQKELLYKIIELSLEFGHFEETISYFEKLKSLEKDTKSLVKLNMKIGMVHMAAGRFEEAEKQFAYCNENYAELLPEIYKDNYEKIVIFNNGESSIEFYKYIHPTKRMVATFDAIDKTVTGKPFAYKLLKKQGVDLISLRRRTANNYHQDITREDYYHAIEKLVSYYDKRFAYGTSLGGYNALFLGSTIPDCKILSMAPRNPAHPIYGTKERKYNKFLHPLSHPVNKDIQPTICYDPKEKVDNPYITKEIMHSYPNAIYKKFYYAGHRVPTYLREAGVLKEIVTLFLSEKPIPDYDRKLHTKSAEYHRVLGIHCRRHKKMKWALALANRSVELAPKYDRSLALRIEILIKIGKLEEAEKYTHEAIEIHPDLSRFYLLLADIYIANGESAKAEKMLEATNKKIRSKKIREKIADLKGKE